jgi:hypothetical protein
VKESVNDIQKRIEQLYGNEINRVLAISKEIKEQLLKQANEDLEALRQKRIEIEESHVSFYNRKKTIDILIYICLATTPILTGIIIYLMFIK